MAFYPKYVALCNIKDVSPSKAAEDIGLSKTAAHGWKNGSTPTDATIAKLEQYFGVETGYFSEENEIKPAPKNESELDDWFYDFVKSLTPSEQYQIVGYIQSLRAAHKD